MRVAGLDRHSHGDYFAYAETACSVSGCASPCFRSSERPVFSLTYSLGSREVPPPRRFRNRWHVMYLRPGFVALPVPDSHRIDADLLDNLLLKQLEVHTALSARPKTPISKYPKQLKTRYGTDIRSISICSRDWRRWSRRAELAVLLLDLYPHFFETVALIDHFHHVTRDAETYQTALLNRWRRRGGCAHAFFYSPRQVGKERIGGEAQQKV